MGCSNPAGDIEIVPIKASYGQYECATVVATADVASSHNNDYFFLYNFNNVKHHVWMNVGGAGVDPAPAGSTPIEVAFAANASAATVAAAIAAAIDAFAGGFWESINESGSASLCICSLQPAVQSHVAAGVGLAGFTYTTDIAGSYTDLGFIDGDVEPTYDVQSLDVKAHQTGTTILTKLVQGKTVTLELSLMEMTDEKYQLVFGQIGVVATPTGGTVNVVGLGTGGNGRNLISNAGKLILHPYNLADSDRSKDLAIWLASLIPTSEPHSGENPQLLKVQLTSYPDLSRQPNFNIFVRGDHLQAGNFKAS